MSRFRLLVKKIVPKNLKGVYRGLRKAVIRAEFKLFKLCPIKQDRVVLCNVWGYGDNPKWVAEALVDDEIRKKENLDFEPEIMYVTDTGRNQNIPRGIKVLRNNSPAAIRALATAKVWLDCNRKESYISKRKGQYYIQTWHGSLPLKKIERDCIDEFTDEYSQNAERDTSMTDLYISNSEFCNELYRRAFGYNGRILMCGSPRVDVLLLNSKKSDEEAKNRVAELRRKITDKDLIAIYAPTFRGDGEKLGLSENGDLIVSALEKRFGKSVCVVKRLHPLCLTKNGGGDGLIFNEKDAVDGNNFGDLYELMSIADVLITDYSNTMFEFSYSGKPVFLFAPDYKEYANERGMYFEYEKLPFPKGKSVSDLADEITSYNEEAYRLRQKEFFVEFKLRENGNASEKVARVILRKLGKRKKN